VALTPKQQRFVDEYLVDLNASAAYRRAGYVCTEAAARANAARLIANDSVAAAIAARQQKAAERAELNQDMVLRSIVQELTFDPAKLYDEDGNLRKVTDLPEDVRMALTAIEFEQHGSPDAPVFVRKVKWAQKQGAREQAMKHLGMFLEDNRQKSGLRQMSDTDLDQLIAARAKESGVRLH